MMNNIILFGAPGSGKGTQSALLEKECGLTHISTGNILRAEVESKSELGLRCSQLMASGVVSDELTNAINEIVASFINNHMRTSKGFIFDGFPRTLAQVEFLDRLLNNLQIPLKKVFELHVERETLIQRLTGRYSCTKCGAIYNKYFSPTKVEGQCDACNSNDFQIRKDDQLETVQHRLNVYKKETSQLLDYYKSKGLLQTLDGLSEPHVVFHEIKECLA